MNRTLVTVLVALALALVALFVYSGSLDNEFVWDDPIVFDRQLPFFDSASSVFFPPRNIPQFGTHYYRPLIVVTYLVDEWVAKTFWKQDERETARRVVYHTSPVVYHMIATVLVFILGLALLRVVAPSPPGGEATGGSPAGGGGGSSGTGMTDTARHLLVAAAGALLFAVHPIHVESVAWMAGRSDVVCAIFFLGSVLAYLRYRTSGRVVFLPLAIVLALGAMLCKETGLGVLLMIPILDWLVARQASAAGAGAGAPQAANRAERRRRERSAASGARTGVAAVAGSSSGSGPLPAWVVWAGFGVAALVFFGLRHAALGVATSPSVGFSPSLGTLPGALGWYVVRAFWPGPQSAFVADIPGGLFAVIGIVVPLAAAGLFVWFARQRRALPELLATALFFGGLALSLAITLFPISETPLAERYLYIPTAGSCLLVAMLVARAVGKVKPDGAAAGIAALAVAAVIAVPASLRVVERAEVWSSNYAFWKDTVDKAGQYGLPHLHLGMVYSERRENDKAQAEYEQALAKYDDSEGRAKAHNNLGSLLLSMGRFDEAIGHFRDALKEDKDYETPHYNWALALLNIANKKTGEERGQLVMQAISNFEEAIRKNPRYVKAHYQYGILLARLKQFDKSRPHLETVIRLAPASAEAKEARANLERMAAGQGVQ